MTNEATTAVAPRIQGMKYDALVIRGKDGVIKNIKSNVKLSVEDGTLVKMGHMTEKVPNPKGGKDLEYPVFMVTAAGAREEAQMSGVMALQPKSIRVNDREQPNNYQDPETGKVYSECIAVGYNKLGQLTAVKRMMIYDAELANIQDLIAKASGKWNKEAFKMAPIKRDSDGNLIAPAACGDSWAGYEIDQAMAIWVDCSHANVFKWQREMVNKRDKAIRTCQTFCERNALFAHPNMPKKKKYYRAEAVAVCHTWYAAEGQLRYDLTKLEIDGDKLLEAAPIEDSKVIDLNEDIDREERNVTDDVIDETDVRQDDAPPANADDEPPLEEQTPPPEKAEDKIPMGDEEPPATEEKYSAEERKQCVDEIRAMIMKNKPTDKKRQKANKAVGWDPEETNLVELTTENLISLRSLYTASI